MKIQGVIDMNYSFDTLKTLYDKYTIEKDNVSGQTVIVDRKTRELWKFEGLFADSVMFAHTWVYATQYNPLKNTSGTSDKELSEDEYGKAFNEASRDIYNAIMEVLVTHLQERGKMLGCSTLTKEVNKKINNPLAENIIKGLYAKKGRHAFLLCWSLRVAGIDIEEFLERQQEKSDEKEANQERSLAA